MEMVYFIPTTQRRLALLASQSDAPVLIHGANGTGKGAIARWIHRQSIRSANTLITAIREKSLRVQIPSAQEGTLVIPEIGELPLGEQKILLQYLQTRTIPHPENPETPMLVNVRIIATTSHNLSGRASGGLFNPDLLDKLNVFKIEMPALAARKDEFRDISLGILGEITKELHKEFIRNVSDQAWNKLEHYEWPGNLRELRNVLRVSAVAAQSEQIELADLPDFGPHRPDFRATREKFKTMVEKLKQTGIEPPKDSVSTETSPES